MPAIVLKPGRDRSLERRHPWIFSGAVDRVEGAPAAGGTVAIKSADGAVLGQASYSPDSQIRARVWSWNEHESIDREWFRSRIAAAVDMREQLGINPSGRRLVYAESDGIPGLIVDQYGGTIVCQFLSTGAEFWRDNIIAVLIERLKPATILDRSDSDIRLKEGMSPRKEVMHGTLSAELTTVTEGECRLYADLWNGHKTGFYLDQRTNRALVARYCRNAEVLNCFAYSGGFAVHALQHAASRVVNIDSSATALELLRKNAELNGFGPDRCEIVEADVFQMMRKYRDMRVQFDVIVLDPPKFVESKVQIERGCRGYKDISLLALKLLRPGGFLATFSCSGLVTPELFQKVTADAAADAGREVCILERLSQASDHPVRLAFPESHYLKGFVCRVC